MSVPLTINGVVYDYPEVDDVDWGPEATDWAAAVTNGMLQKSGGLFQLLAEVDFGTAFGVAALYFKTRTSNTASTGQFRLARADVINWRNEANDGNLSLAVNSSNLLTFNGTAIQNTLSVTDTATIDLTLAADVLSAAIVTGSITNAMVSGSAAIAYSKLALTGSIVNGDLVNVSESTFKGRQAGAGTGAPQDLTATQATAILNNFVGDSGAGGTKGLTPAPAAGDAAAQKFLKANGSWETPPGAGDVVGPASSTNNGFVKFDGTTGKLVKDSAATLVNADISASAAIVYSKLVLTDSIVNADINSAAAIAYSKLNLSASIVNADVATGAAIAYAKLAALTANRALVSDGSGVVSVATTTATEIGYVNGVTSAIQTQIDSKTSNPMTTGGDIIYGGASGVPTRLANGSAGQYLASAGGTSAPVWTSFPRSQIYYDGGNGRGSTNTGIRIFANQRISTGSAITYATSAALGDSFTINEDGLYSMTYSDSSSAGISEAAIILNGNSLSTAPSGVTFSNGKRSMSNAAVNLTTATSVALYLVAGDVIRAGASGNNNSTDQALVIFNIIKISN